MSTAPQEWLSELQVDERRKLLVDSMVREHGEDWNNEQGKQELSSTAAELLTKPWFEALTLQEVDDLSATQGWDWYGCLDFEEEVEFDVRDLVQYKLIHALSFLEEEGDELLASDLRRGTDHVQTQLSFLRTVASKYGFTMTYLFKKMRELEAGSE